MDRDERRVIYSIAVFPYTKDMLQFFLQERHYNFHANQTKPKGRKDDLVLNVICFKVI